MEPELSLDFIAADFTLTSAAAAPDTRLGLRPEAEEFVWSGAPLAAVGAAPEAEAEAEAEVEAGRAVPVLAGGVVGVVDVVAKSLGICD